MILPDDIITRFEELFAAAPSMADETPLSMHAEAMGFPQLWHHADGRALLVTRTHCYVPAPDVLAAVERDFEDIPRHDGVVAVFCLRPLRERRNAQTEAT